jgi:hypothetical protein
MDTSLKIYPNHPCGRNMSDSDKETVANDSLREGTLELSVPASISTLDRTPHPLSSSPPLCKSHTINSTQPLRKRGEEWKNKLIGAIQSRILRLRLKALGWTDTAILDFEPSYYYDEEFHGLHDEPGYLKSKSLSDFRTCTSRPEVVPLSRRRSDV